MNTPEEIKTEIEPVLYSRNEHCLSRSNIDPDALKIMYRLIRHGYKAYLVGGGVRDLLLKKKPKDFDIATDATPRRIKSLFRNCRIIGRRFKLAHIYFRGNKIIEVSTFRDIDAPIDASAPPEAPNTHQNNTFGTAATDATRRDLTINGLFYDLATFSIIDYVGGMKDHEAQIIRIIGDPDVRFHEDPVRMIRAVRHAARAKFSIEASCWDSIQNNHELIKTASPVRIYEEVRKDLCSHAGLSITRLLAQSNLLQHLIPELLLNDSVLLKEGSFFAQVFTRIEASSVADEDFTITSVLAVIALFLSCYPESSEALHVYFEDREELSDHLSSCFVKLAVPRKERERIEDVLILWHRLKNMPVDKAKKTNLERRRCISELYYILLWLSENPEEDELLCAVEKARHKRTSGSNQRRRSRSTSPKQDNTDSGRSRGTRNRSRGNGRRSRPRSTEETQES